MNQLIAFLFLFQFQSSSETLNLVKGVERSFAQMNDFRADFHQISRGILNQKQEAAGHLYLKKSKMARWEYKTPEEQFFISDGKTVYLYVPADKQVNKEPVKETFDDRIPLMFLLGRSNLSNEFKEFTLLNTEPHLAGTKVVRMIPKRKTDLKELIMEVDPQNYQIRRLIMEHVDERREEFIFSNIRINTGLKASQFEFKIPAGVQVIEGLGQ